MNSKDEEQGARIVECARAYLGTPWQHQGRTRAGIDCCGFIVEVALAAEAVPNTRFESDYRRRENGERMLALLDEYLIQVEIDEVKPGDVLALCDEQLRRRDIPTHLMILTQLAPYWKAIHASEHGVREHRLDAHWKRRIQSVWRTK